MKIFRSALALLLVAGGAWAVQGAPINTTCPLKGEPAKPNITSVYKGKTVAFCCGNCKGQFDANPEKYVSLFPGLAGPAIRTGLSSIPEGLKSGKEGSHPVLILFLDTGAKSKQWTEQLGDKSLDEVMGKVIYVAVEYKKDGEEEKKYQISAAPSLILVADPTKEDAKGKKISSPAPQEGARSGPQGEKVGADDHPGAGPVGDGGPGPVSIPAPPLNRRPKWSKMGGVPTEKREEERCSTWTPRCPSGRPCCRGFSA
jgi:YHS domain-containing protein